MKIDGGKIVKILVPVASLAVGIATNYLNKKELDDNINKKVQEALAKANNAES